MYSPSGRKQLRFLHIDADFTQIRWGWRQWLMIDAIDDVAHRSRTCTVTFGIKKTR